MKMIKPTGRLDSDGNDIYLGDTLRSSFGIPPVAIKGKVVHENGEYVVKTPKANPKQCTLDEFFIYVGDVWVDND